MVDDHTVRFDLKNVNTGIVYTLAQVYVVPEHVWSKVADPVTFTNAPNPVGTGPLTEIRRFTPQEYIQCRNPNYWDAAHLKVDCLRLPQIANNDQALAAAATGELDWFGSFLPDIEKTYVAKDPENHKYWFPAGSIVFFAMNFGQQERGQQDRPSTTSTSAMPCRWRWTARRWSISPATAIRRSTSIPPASAAPMTPGTTPRSTPNTAQFARHDIEARQEDARRRRLQGRRRRRLHRDARRQADRLRHPGAQRLDRLGQHRAARRRGPEPSSASTPRSRRRNRRSGRSG